MPGTAACAHLQVGKTEDGTQDCHSDDRPLPAVDHCRVGEQLETLVMTLSSCCNFVPLDVTHPFTLRSDATFHGFR